MISKEITTYQDGATTLEGHFAVDDAVHGQRPGILVVPEWWGITKFTLGRCDALAAMGYVAFAADIYGKGIMPDTFAAAQQISKPYYDDRALLRRRGHAGLDALRAHPLVDPHKIAGIGYCFGGITLLELARDGADLSGIVAFHTQLLTSMPAQPRAVTAKILVLHGAYDPVVPQQEINDFIQEMRNANVDWQMISYGNAVHSYTNADWPPDPTHTKPTAYNEAADRRSWIHMQDFFRELFPG